MSRTYGVKANFQKDLHGQYTKTLVITRHSRRSDQKEPHVLKCDAFIHSAANVRPLKFILGIPAPIKAISRSGHLKCSAGGARMTRPRRFDRPFCQ